MPARVYGSVCDSWSGKGEGDGLVMRLERAHHTALSPSLPSFLFSFETVSLWSSGCPATVYTRLDLNSQWSACFCLWNSGITGMHRHCLALFFLYLPFNLMFSFLFFFLNKYVSTTLSVCMLLIYIWLGGLLLGIRWLISGEGRGSSQGRPSLLCTAFLSCL